MDCGRLGALLWKSWLGQRRRPLWTLAEVLVPLALMSALVAVHFRTLPEHHDDTVYPAFTINGDARDFFLENVDGNILLSPAFRPSQLYYTPSTPVTQAVIRKLLDRLNLQMPWAPSNPCSQVFAAAVDQSQIKSLPPSSRLTATALDNATVLEKTLFDMLKDSYSSTFYAGIVFDDGFAGGNATHVKYSLRFPFEERNLLPDMLLGSVVYSWSTNQPGISDYQQMHRWPNSSDGGIPSYWREGFLTLQHALDTVLIESMQPRSLCTMGLINIKLRRIPFIAYTNHPLIQQFATIMPSVLVVSFLQSLLYVTRSVTIEKQKRLTEYIGIIGGVPVWLQWLSHFCVNFVKLTIVSVIITAMLCTTILASSNPLLIGIFIWSFALNVIAFAFFIGAFFRNANNATLCAGVAWFLIYVPCLYAQRLYTELGRTQKLAFSLLANGASVIACQIIGNLEARGSGLNFGNFISKPFDNDDDVAPYEVFLLLLFDALPMFLLAYYVDALRFGGRPWYCVIPCLSLFYQQRTDQIGDRGAPIVFDSNSVEETGQDSRASVVIDSAVVKYRDRRRCDLFALNQLSFFAQPGEITVVLGHNGAGKTTLMRVLTGCLKLNRGYAYVNDMDVHSNMEGVRRSLGYCPQYNTLFDCLTVEEHLKFYLMLKKSSGYNSAERIGRLLSKLRLDKKRDQLSKHLSGGQKRRLSLAIALVSGNPVILLDEPTSGMDPGGKADIIDVLKYEKQPNVTFILVTHYVDEAELLGDRVAILTDGRLRCYGTNLFLKNRFSSGYRVTLRFVKDSENIPVERLAKNVQTALEEVCLGACRFLCVTGDREATFLMRNYTTPKETCTRHQMVLLTLEKLADVLSIGSVSLNMPSMQDVFVNCSTQTSSEALDKPAVMNGQRADDVLPSLVLSTSSRNTGASLFAQQFWACLRKRAVYSWRQKRLLLCQLVVLLLSVGVGGLLNDILRRHNPVMPPLDLSVNMFAGTRLPLARLSNGTSGVPTFLANQVLDAVGRHGFVGLVVDQLTDNVTDAGDWLLRTMRTADPDQFTRRRLFAVDFDDRMLDGRLTLVGYFSPRLSQSTAVVLNAFNNAILRLFCPECQIVAVNHPLPQSTILYYPFGEDFVTILCLIVGLAFFVAAFAVAIVEERANGAKHLQLLAGLNLAPFWLANLIWDALLYIVACVLVIGIWLLWNNMMVEEWIGVAYVALILAAYGVAIVPLTYAISFGLRSAASAVTVLTSINLLCGITPTLSVAILAHLSFGQPDLMDVERKLTHICSAIFPQFALARAFMAFYNNQIMRTQCESMHMCEILESSSNVYFRVTKNPLEWELPGIGRLLVCAAAQGVVFFSLVLLIEWMSQRPSRFWHTSSSAAASSAAAPSIWFGSCDRKVVVDDQLNKPDQNIPSEERLLDVCGLSVRYGGGCRNVQPLWAVDDLSFRVYRGEIFGFNGENGSGKTSTYKMLTGLLRPCCGTAFISGKDVRCSWRKAASCVGYCPQFDALLERYTGFEMLMHFGRLRGLDEKELVNVVENLLTTFGCMELRNRLIQYYSGGNKRKISIAAALIGAPTLLLMDEPTCGVDPKARRTIWQILKTLKCVHKTAVVLTSHDMEETEALCDRMGVLSKGRLVCVDTPAALAELYSGNYLLRLTVENEYDLEDVEEAVFTMLPDVQLKAKPNNRQVHFAVPKSTKVTWSGLYQVVEKLLERWPLSDFAVSQAGLQDAFVTLSRGDIVPKTEPPRVAVVTTAWKNK